MKRICTGSERWYKCSHLVHVVWSSCNDKADICNALICAYWASIRHTATQLHALWKDTTVEQTQSQAWQSPQLTAVHLQEEELKDADLQSSPEPDPGLSVCSGSTGSRRHSLRRTPATRTSSCLVRGPVQLSWCGWASFPGLWCLLLSVGWVLFVCVCSAGIQL